MRFTCCLNIGFTGSYFLFSMGRLFKGRTCFLENIFFPLRVARFIKAGFLDMGIDAYANILRMSVNLVAFETLLAVFFLAIFLYRKKRKTKISAKY